MTNARIHAAATLIADIDPALARAFLAQPFNRSAMVTVLHASMCRSGLASVADSVAVFCRSAIDSTRVEVAA